MQSANERRVTGRRKGIIISISDYDNLQSLDFCKRDGEDMSMVLRDIGYEIAEDNEFIGAVESNQMKDAIIKFFTHGIYAEDTLLFYYSGHAIQDVDGELFLATSEIDPNEPISSGFSFYDLTKMMQKSRSLRIVAALDCCFSGAAKLGGASGDISKGNEEDAAKFGTDAIDKGSSALERGEGKCLLAASLSYQEATKVKEGEHSLFTDYLIKGLKPNENSVDQEGNVTPDSLGKYIYKSIVSLPEKDKPKQKPIRSQRITGDIILASYPKLARPKGKDLLILLLQGKITDFNNIREQSRYTYLDLRGENLRDTNLSSANLAGADLRGASLSGADLNEAELRGAKLNEADLRDAHLHRANLSQADLSDADLSGADLGGAKLSSADLGGAKLRGAKLREAILIETDLRGANLGGADLSGANLLLSILINANLINTNLAQANLTKAKLRGANLKDADISSALDLSEADLRDTKNLSITKEEATKRGAII